MDVMQSARAPTSFTDGPLSGTIDWDLILEAVGTERFEVALRHTLAALVGEREVCIAFYHEAFGEIAAGCGCSQVVCAFPSELRRSPHWVHFTDGHWRAAIAFTLPRSLAWIESSELSRRVASSAGILAALLRKHFELCSTSGTQPALNQEVTPHTGACQWLSHSPPRALHAYGDLGPLASLTTIERCLADRTSLPTREREVCSRILHGLSSPAIAVDLHLRDSTVKTYRKRAYQRLAIGSERELLNWYLCEWGRWLQPQIDPWG